MAFHRLQVEVAKKEETLRVASVEVGTLQALLDTERKSSTLSSALERELVWLRHAYIRLSEVARDLGFDATGLKELKDCPILGYFGFLNFLNSGFKVLGRSLLGNVDTLGHSYKRIAWMLNYAC